MKQNKISRSARGQECTARLSGYCDSETVVLAHAPYSGRYGSRQSWWWSARICSSCHDILDNRTHRIYTQSELREMWYEAIRETQQAYMDEGLMTLKL